MSGNRVVRLVLVALVATFLPCATDAGEATTGPVIEGYGPVHDVEKPVHAADPKHLRAVFDVATAAEDPAEPNRGIVTVARFLNMHARAGYPKHRVRAALVLHAGATEAALSHEAYRRRHGRDNPDLELISKLRAAGVRVFLCGQSAANRGIERAEIASDVDVALSAMTVLVQLQAEGYALIAF